MNATAPILVLIMAGGRGERFWPKSRAAHPKQFLSLVGGRSLLQQTVDRVRRLVGPEHIFVVTGSEYGDLAKSQLAEMPTENILLEPIGRDTSACVALGAAVSARINPNSTLLVLPADHYVGNDDEWERALREGLRLAQWHNQLVLFGVRPTRPETGYGYIKMGARHEQAFTVERFVEKPDSALAMEYLQSGTFLWNSGMFACPVDLLLGSMQTYALDKAGFVSALLAAPSWEELWQEVEVRYPHLVKVSIDYELLEHIQGALVLPVAYPWDDLGSWSAVERLRMPDDDENTLHGAVVTHDCRRVFVEGSDERVTVLVGVEDLVVVNDDDHVLICARERMQEIKKVVAPAEALYAQLKSKALATKANAVG